MAPSFRPVGPDGIAPTSTRSANLSDALKQATARLRRSPTPRLDAEILLMHVTGHSRSHLIVREQDLLAPEREVVFNELLSRRARGEPIAYLVGQKEFWSLKLRVDPRVLIPRPETELLVELALARVSPSESLQMADLGTGSGAVALAIAHERPRSRIVATDVSDAALAVARANADRLGLRNVEFRAGSWFAPLATGRFHVMVSNPPYVADRDECLNDGDLAFEPRLALVAGADGLDALRQIVTGAGPFLIPGGALILEHGFDHGAAVRKLMAGHGFVEVHSATDLAGHERVTIGTTRS